MKAPSFVAGCRYPTIGHLLKDNRKGNLSWPFMLALCSCHAHNLICITVSLFFSNVTVYVHSCLLHLAHTLLLTTGQMG